MLYATIATGSQVYNLTSGQSITIDLKPTEPMTIPVLLENPGPGVSELMFIRSTPQPNNQPSPGTWSPSDAFVSNAVSLPSNITPIPQGQSIFGVMMFGLLPTGQQKHVLIEAQVQGLYQDGYPELEYSSINVTFNGVPAGGGNGGGGGNGNGGGQSENFLVPGLIASGLLLLVLGYKEEDRKRG